MGQGHKGDTTTVATRRAHPRGKHLFSVLADKVDYGNVPGLHGRHESGPRDAFFISGSRPNRSRPLLARIPVFVRD